MLPKEWSKKRPMLKGKIEEVIYAQLGLGDDLLRGIWDVCAQNDVKTGLLLDATGCMRNLRLHAIAPGAPFGINFAEIPGYVEVSAHGIIGIGSVPDKSVKPPPEILRSSHETGFGGAGFVGDGAPYCHVHITGSNSKETICGHLLEGSIIGTQYFQIVIAKVSGVVLKATWDKRGYPEGYYHELLPA
ncbi:DNA-binding protein [Bradyrhizobium hipponense]|uniref:DNA-binding protein n=1 Tax=Bradyrhizobium hipponense TaxID=2605638 RepID=A0A5S4YA24_9BRAD|nr:DUF296 domain-containing protein [Bradyrhizobium hipponense]TYO60868.1 DNA-binding protein [Bradyrhizobium hipponense]